MSSLSPVQRLRTRTSDFSDFFRPSTRTRIPFLRRNRKKSLDSSPPEHPSDSSSSLTSKLASRFSPKHRPTNTLPSTHSSLTLNDPAPPSSSLTPPSPGPRQASFDSASTATQDRAPTPRPLRPTITVSVPPPEDLDAFSDLFTRPNPPTSPQSPDHPTTDSVESSDDDKLDLPEVTTPDPSPPPPPPMQLPNPSFDSGNPPALTVPFHMDDSSTSDFSAHHLDRPLSQRSPSTNETRPTRKKQLSISIWRELENGLGTQLDPDSGEESDHDLVFDPTYTIQSPTEPSISPWKRQTVATMPYKSSERSTSSRSLKSLTSPSGPPSIPLPSPPVGSPSFSSLPTIPSIPTVSSSSLPTRNSRRPRAYTITSTVSTTPSTTGPTATRSSSLKSNRKPTPKPSESNQTECATVDNATTEQLRQALKAQRARFDDLARYLLSVTAKHSAEKAALMKRIDTLEREARKTGRELKGLRYLVMHGTGSGLPSTLNNRPSSLVDGPDSRRAASESIYPKNALGNLSPNISRSTSLLVPAGSGKHDFPGPYIFSNDKRSSVSSYSSSATSSTSSLSLPTLAVPANPALSPALSVIPEARTPTPDSGRNRDRVPEPPPPPTVITIATDRQREKEERRASRTLHRLSSSSTASSTSSAASFAYPANLKRGRPPSIAQVLGESSSMEDVLEKFRPLAASTTVMIPSHASRESSAQETVTVPTCL